MGWFSKLWKTAEPPGRVVVVSDGLSAFGQREIAFAVRLRPGESAATVRADLETMVDTIRGLAERGQLVHVGEVTELARPGFLDSPMHGIVYGDARGTDPEIPSTALVGVLVDTADLELAKSTSVARVLSRLGEATRTYPFPTTSDRDRPSVARDGDEQSVLAMTPLVSTPDVSLLQSGGKLVIRCRPSARHTLGDALARLPEDTAFALVTTPDPTADAQLVWFPGQTGPAAITPPGSSGARMTGTMLLVAAGVEDDRVSIHEDGFALLARAETWARVRRALLEGGSHELPPTRESMGLRVEPISDEWNRYEPAGGARRTEEIVLLTPEAQLAEAVSVEALSRYVRGLMDELQPVIEPMALRVELRPDAEPRLSSRAPTLPHAVMERLLAIAPPAVRGPVAFEIHKRGGPP